MAWIKISAHWILSALSWISTAKILNDEYRIVENATLGRLFSALVGGKVVKAEGLKKGAELTADAVAEYSADDWFAIRMDNAELNDQIAAAQAQLG